MKDKQPGGLRYNDSSLCRTIISSFPPELFHSQLSITFYSQLIELMIRISGKYRRSPTCETPSTWCDCEGDRRGIPPAREGRRFEMVPLNTTEERQTELINRPNFLNQILLFLPDSGCRVSRRKAFRN